MVELVTKKSEHCYLSCVACGGYMQGKTCNLYQKILDVKIDIKRVNLTPCQAH